jgi:S1-C subfamily serine protease
MANPIAINLAFLRAERAFGGRFVADAIPKHKAVVFLGPGQVEGEDDTTLAQRAVDKLRNGQDPQPEELAALDACIRLVRPAFFVCGGIILTPPDARSLPGLPDDWKSALGGYLGSIAAIGFQSEPTGIGTGFLVSPRMLLTANHVADRLRGRPGVARFGLEYQRTPFPDPIIIRRVAARHNFYDLAILELKADPLGGVSIPLARMSNLKTGHPVVTVGHPLRDSRNPLPEEVLFDGIFGYKRASPGELLGADQCGHLLHDCTTLGGNSGSPIFDAETGMVLGIHTDGIFGLRNSGLMTRVVETEPAIANLVHAWG